MHYNQGWWAVMLLKIVNDSTTQSRGLAQWTIQGQFIAYSKNHSSQRHRRTKPALGSIPLLNKKSCTIVLLEIFKAPIPQQLITDDAFQEVSIYGQHIIGEVKATIVIILRHCAATKTCPKTPFTLQSTSRSRSRQDLVPALQIEPHSRDD